MSEDNMMTDSSNSDKEVNSSASSSLSGGASATGTAVAVTAVVANNGAVTAVPANGLAPNGQATPTPIAPAGVAIKDDLIDEENDEDDLFDEDKEARGAVVGAPGGCGSGVGQDEGGANAGVDVERLRAFNVSSHSLTIHSPKVF